MNEDEKAMATIRLGIEVDNFVQSNIGTYLLAQAENEITAARIKLDDIDPEDSKSIRKLQNDIYCAKSFRAWLIYAVQDGLNAEYQLTGERN
jgi:hypothetical protein